MKVSFRGLQICLLSLTLVIGAGCNGDLNSRTDNGHVEVFNFTDAVITVFYQEEEEVGEEVVLFDRVAHIAPGASEFLYIDTSGFIGTVRVQYGTQLIQREVVFSLFSWGPETLEIRVEDFAGAPSLDLGEPAAVNQ